MNDNNFAFIAHNILKLIPEVLFGMDLQGQSMSREELFRQTQNRGRRKNVDKKNMSCKIVSV